MSHTLVNPGSTNQTQDKNKNKKVTNDNDSPANTSDYEGSDTNSNEDRDFWNEINYSLSYRKQSTATTIDDDADGDDDEEKARSNSPTSPGNSSSSSSSRSGSQSPSFDYYKPTEFDPDYDYDSGVGIQMPPGAETCICEEENMSQYRFLKCSCKLNNKPRVLKKKRESNANLRKNSLSGNRNRGTMDTGTDLPQFSRSSVGGSKFLLSCHPTLEPSDLIFESRFESGNLAKAVKITPTYYELYLRPDMYTNRHTQWFYFRVKNTKKGCVYR